MITPNLLDKIKAFIGDFTLKKLDGNVYLPAPKHNHPVLYDALVKFCLGFSAYQIILIAIKFHLRVKFSQKVETISSLIFWLVVGYSLSLLKEQKIDWFGLIAILIILGGIGLLLRVLSISFDNRERRTVNNWKIRKFSKL